jgi:hypothetical protein
MYPYSAPVTYVPPANDAIIRAIETHMPGRTVQSVQDRGVWIRHIIEIALDNGESVFIKITCGDFGNDKEVFVSQLLRDNDLPAPRTFAYDDSGDIITEPFIIQEKLGGTRLGDLLDHLDETDARDIYAAMGRFYRQLHAITYAHSGWIIDGTGLVGSTAPNDHMYQQVIVTIGKQAVACSHLSEATYQRLVDLWRAKLPELNDHIPALVGIACYWTVALDKVNDAWQVVRVMDLGDFLYWDAAFELAAIKYPVFRPALAKQQWNAFVSAYGAVPDDNRLRLYHLLQRLDAAMGNYLAPRTTENDAWMRTAWADFDSLMDAIK